MWSEKEIAAAKQAVLDRTWPEDKDIVDAKIDGFLATLEYNRALRKMLEASQACVDEISSLVDKVKS